MIAQQIRQLRLSKGITQKELAEAIHVTPSAISQYENGKAQPSRENMMLLAGIILMSAFRISKEPLKSKYLKAK